MPLLDIWVLMPTLTTWLMTIGEVEYIERGYITSSVYEDYRNIRRFSFEGRYVWGFVNLFKINGMSSLSHVKLRGNIDLSEFDPQNNLRHLKECLGVYTKPV